ncbi:YchJ family protein [Ferrimonas pelagia]|uniref:YchJ family protein n=2 Tax=Ferrimonas pelagia TaxID=1177826 RepID=A0ABP9EAZ5_9GAMM
MRSRYCAYVQHQTHYLLDTHHPDYRDGLTLDALAEACETTSWDHLEIVMAPPVQGNEGTVEFKAWYQQPEGLGVLHERSRFLRENQQWFYCDGEFGPAALKAGRNDPCPCGSGKKFKRCCG